MTSYPLREYISSKKDDDYLRSFSSSRYFYHNKQDSSETKYSNYLICAVTLIVFCLIYYVFYSYYSFVDPTCFNRECQEFVCQAYSEGLIGGHLCPDLCTAESVQLQNCLGEHKHFRSRLFDDNEGNQVIRCYLKHIISQSTPTQDLKEHFHFPEEDSTLNTLYRAVEEHVQKTIRLENHQSFIDDLFKFADFNQDDKISLSEARSLWSLVQIEEFLYTMLLSDKGYIPKIVGTCGHVFALEKVIHRTLPFDTKQELFSSTDRPNWFQRVRIAVGIIEFFSDTWHHQDTDEHLFLCQPLMKSFGYDKDYESKMLKSNHLISSKSILSQLSNGCTINKDCLFDSYCSGTCNTSTNLCQMKEFNPTAFSELCSLIASLVVPEGNSTFLQNFDPLANQCQQIASDQTLLEKNYVDRIGLQIRQTLLLQNLRNLLWTNIEYQMIKITKKSTKKPVTQSPVH